MLLQDKIDSLEFNLKIKTNEVETGKKVKKMEESALTKQSAMNALSDQIKFFKNKSHICDKLKEEIALLKNRIKDMENMELVISGSRSMVEDIIRNENSVESLALLAATLKK